MCAVSTRVRLQALTLHTLPLRPTSFPFVWQFPPISQWQVPIRPSPFFHSSIHPHRVFHYTTILSRHSQEVKRRCCLVLVLEKEGNTAALGRPLYLECNHACIKGSRGWVIVRASCCQICGHMVYAVHMTRAWDGLGKSNYCG